MGGLLVLITEIDLSFIHSNVTEQSRLVYCMPLKLRPHDSISLRIHLFINVQKRYDLILAKLKVSSATGHCFFIIHTFERLIINLLISVV